LPVFGQPLWYLGLDLGSCGIRAVLCEQRSRQIHPLQWRDSHGELSPELPLAFRWSLQAETPGNLRPVLPPPASLALDLHSQVELEVDRFKAYLQHMPPLDSTAAELKLQGQPWVEGGEDLPPQRRQPRISLDVSPQLLTSGLSALFRRLSPDFLAQFPGLCQSPLLTTAEMPEIFSKLAGVILNCPSDASANYRSLLRQAVLDAQLVDLPSRIVFLEEAVAALFSHVPLPTGQILVVHGSYSRTELALLTLPQGATSIQGVMGFNWGQAALTQAIVGQLLYPLLPSAENDRSPLDTFNLPAIPTVSPDALQPTSALQQQVLHWKLRHSPLGDVFLQAAERLQATLQTQEQFTLRIGQQTHILQAQAWQTQIVQPYHHTLQQTLQTLLQRSQLPATAIDYILGTGSLGHQAWVLQGLRSLCPTATILETPSESIEQVAVGLAQFPLQGNATVP
jgi:hypothetical protein